MAIFQNKDEILELIEKFDKSSVTDLEISTGVDFSIKLVKSWVNINKTVPDIKSDIIPDVYEEENIDVTDVFDDLSVGRGDPDAPLYINPKDDGKIIKAPLIGTFYSCASPDSEPYVKVGDKITKGTIICIIEAMKTMNEIESDTDGEIAEILVKNGVVVEYGQLLFRLK